MLRRRQCELFGRRRGWHRLPDRKLLPSSSRCSRSAYSPIWAEIQLLTRRAGNVRNGVQRTVCDRRAEELSGNYLEVLGEAGMAPARQLLKLRRTIKNNQRAQ